MEVPRIAGQNDDAARRIRRDLIAVESVARPMWKTPDITV